VIPDAVVEQVREQSDIVAVVGEHVKLKRQGASFRGPCPFHHGKDPNFSVHPKTNTYRCFVCGESGDVFDFVRKHLGLDFTDAVKYLGARAGVEVVEVTSARSREERDKREPLWEVIGAAADFFQRALWVGEQGAAARDYLASRDVDRATAERFGLGFAPRETDAMRGALEALGFDAARQLEAGVLVQREGYPEPRPRFRGRLMFPIWDAAGHPVGFGGRALDPATEPKYLNSAESAVFNKGRLLYALNWSKNAIRKDGRAVVVEGYFDALRLIASGVESVVAPLGTALTEDQAALLTKYSRNVFLLYDSDKAGLKATFRSGDELLRQGASVRVVTLPPGEDPDTFVAAKGAAGLEAQLAAAIDVFERKIQLLERAGWFADLHRRRRALDRLLPTVRATADPLTRDLYLTRASEASGVDKALLLRELEEVARRESRGARGEARPAASERGRPEAGGDRRRSNDRRVPQMVRAFGAERDLVRLMLHHREQVERIAEQYGPEAFRDRHYHVIFAQLLHFGHDATLDEIAGAIPDEETVRELNELLSEPDAVGDVERTIEAAVARLRIRELKDKLDELQSMIGVAADHEKDALMREKDRLARELRAVNMVR
jgi:DNA primase